MEVYKVCWGSCEERKPKYLGFWIEYNVEKKERGSNILTLLGKLSSGEEGEARKETEIFWEKNQDF